MRMKIIHANFRLAVTRLGYLLYTLRAERKEKYASLVNVINFVQMIATYSLRFALYFDPPELKKGKAALLQLACLDPAVAFKPVINKYRNVILSSPSFTPPEIFGKLLDFKYDVFKSFTLDTKLSASFCPLILTKANDNVSFLPPLR